MSQLREEAIDIINEIVEEGHNLGFLYDYDLVDYDIDNDSLAIMVADLFTEARHAKPRP